MGPREPSPVSTKAVAWEAMPVRAEVVGSLLRPPELVEARKAREVGQVGEAEFKRLEDEAVREAVRLQEDAGIDVITDGELRRYAFYGHLVDSCAGFDKLGGWSIPFRDETGEELVLRRPVVVERLNPHRHMCAEEWTYLRAVARRPGKVTMLSAMQAATYYDRERSRDAYPDLDAFGTSRMTGRWSWGW